MVFFLTSRVRPTQLGSAKEKKSPVGAGNWERDSLTAQTRMLNITFNKQWTLEEWCSMLPKLQRFARRDGFKTALEAPVRGWSTINALPPGKSDWETQSRPVLMAAHYGDCAFGPIHLLVDVNPATRDLGKVWLATLGSQKLTIPLAVPWVRPTVREFKEESRMVQVTGIGTSGWEVEGGTTEYSHDLLAIPASTQIPAWLTHWTSETPPKWNGRPLSRGPGVRYLHMDQGARLVNGRTHFLGMRFLKGAPTSMRIESTTSSRHEWPAQRCEVQFDRHVIQIAV